MLIDTHTHLLKKYYPDPVQMVADLADQGLESVLNVGFDLDSSVETASLTHLQPVFGAVGVHPHSAESLNQRACDQLAELCRTHPRIVAIGEIGLDYHYAQPERDVQLRAFVRQLELADSLHLPVIIHLRDAFGDMMDIIRAKKNFYGGIFHCFSGSAELARELADRGYMISFSGSVTFKNATNIAAACAVVPDDKLLIETDCPYLAPTPHRGKTNYPHFVALVAAKVAEIRGTTFDQIAQLTSANARRFFGIRGQNNS